MRFASASGMRGNGVVGTVTSMPNAASISAPCFSLTAASAGDEQLLVHPHDVFVRVDPADLGVDRDELGGVPAREAGVGAERRRDLEHLAEPGGLGHLLEELGALREVGGALEVADLEQLGA